MYNILTLPMNIIPYYFYPRIYKISDIHENVNFNKIYLIQENYGTICEESQFMIKPPCLPAAMDKMGMGEAFLIDNGEYLYLYLSSSVNDGFIQQVFGYHNFSDLKFNGITTFTPIEEQEASMKLSQLIEQIRNEKGGCTYQPLRLIYAGSKDEKIIMESCLVEDSADINKDFPYSEFLCMLHKLIRNKTS